MYRTRAHRPGGEKHHQPNRPGSDDCHRRAGGHPGITHRVDADCKWLDQRALLRRDSRRQAKESCRSTPNRFGEAATLVWRGPAGGTVVWLAALAEVAGAASDAISNRVDGDEVAD